MTFDSGSAVLQSGGHTSKGNDGAFVDWPVERALVKLDGVCYDCEGAFDPNSVKPPQRIKAKSEEGVFWFEDEFLDDDQWEAMHQALEESRRPDPSTLHGCTRGNDVPRLR